MLSRSNACGATLSTARQRDRRFTVTIDHSLQPAQFRLHGWMVLMQRGEVPDMEYAGGLLRENVMSAFDAEVIADFKKTAGKPGGYFKHAPVLLLHTTGAKSGEARLNPLMYLHMSDGGPFYIFASYGGAPKNPAWFHNLVANPEIEIEVGDGTTIERLPMRARVVEGEERDTIYAEQARRFPQFAEYEQKTTRKIPVVELTRR